jgi:hypothetical protein
MDQGGEKDKRGMDPVRIDDFGWEVYAKWLVFHFHTIF